MPPGTPPRTMPLMVGRRHVGFLTLLVGAVLGGGLLVGPLSSPASASGPVTNCQIFAENNPSTVGQNVTFRFFAAARAPEDVPPSPTGLVTFVDLTTGDVLGVEFMPPNLTEDN